MLSRLKQIVIPLAHAGNCIKLMTAALRSLLKKIKAQMVLFKWSMTKPLVFFLVVSRNVKWLPYWIMLIVPTTEVERTNQRREKCDEN